MALAYLTLGEAPLLHQLRDSARFPADNGLSKRPAMPWGGYQMERQPISA